MGDDQVICAIYHGRPQSTCTCPQPCVCVRGTPVPAGEKVTSMCEHQGKMYVATEQAVWLHVEGENGAPGRLAEPIQLEEKK